MEWSEKFEVGHPKIDLEHRVFFDLVQSVENAKVEGASRDKLRRLTAEISKYAEFHFLSEENIMIDIGYPGFEEHHAHHIALLKKLQNFIIGFETGKNDVEDLVQFVNNWFVKHTSNEDLWLSKYISKK